ncbi:unnamed protein product [Lota lota]
MRCLAQGHLNTVEDPTRSADDLLSRKWSAGLMLKPGVQFCSIRVQTSFMGGDRQRSHPRTNRRDTPGESLVSV